MGPGELQRDVRAIHSPLLPCGLFLTLRFEATDNDLEQLLKGETGYHAFRLISQCRHLRLACHLE